MRMGMMAGLTAMLACVPVAYAQDAPAPRPTPVGNPGDWIPPNAYPPAARASLEEGRVAFTLDVDETGRVADCRVTQSSESPLLDETTCALMSSNGRFEPPRDKKNKPMASKWTSSVRWKLEGTAPPPISATPSAAPVAAPMPVATPAPPAPKPTFRRKARR